MSKSKKAVFLKEWTAEVGQSMQSFHEGSALMVRKHQKSSVKTTAFAATLHTLSQKEHSASVKNALECLSVEMSAGEEHRSHTLQQLQANMVAQFDKYPAKLKVQEDNIQARNRAFATFVKKQKAFVASKASANPSKQRHAREVFEHEHKRLQSAEQTLNSAIVSFEAARVADIKSILVKFVSSEMYFYARQLEGLSRAYQQVVAVDAHLESERWGEEMKKLEQMELEQGDISQLLSQADGNDAANTNIVNNNNNNNNMALNNNIHMQPEHMGDQLHGGSINSNMNNNNQQAALPNAGMSPGGMKFNPYANPFSNNNLASSFNPYTPSPAATTLNADNNYLSSSATSQSTLVRQPTTNNINNNGNGRVSNNSSSFVQTQPISNHQNSPLPGFSSTYGSSAFTNSRTPSYQHGGAMNAINLGNNNSAFSQSSHILG